MCDKVRANMRFMDLDADALALMAELVSRDTVCSVACDYSDPALWDIFLEEQVARAKRTGLPPQIAFTLCGPDTGLPRGMDAVAMGAAVHTPYEGITAGDLFIQPKWRVFDPELANAEGSLRAGNRTQCHYLLTHNDFGELVNTRRSMIGRYFLYESTLPYRPADPLDQRGALVAKTFGIEWEKIRHLHRYFDGERLPVISQAALATE